MKFRDLINSRRRSLPQPQVNSMQQSKPAGRPFGRMLGALGIIPCPNCEFHWSMEYVPEYCPNCGAKVTDKPAGSYENIIKYIKDQRLGIPLSRCISCHKEVILPPELHHDMCPYCKGEVVRVDTGNSDYWDAKLAKLRQR